MWIELADLFWLTLVTLLCFSWWHNLKMREWATRKVIKACDERDVQLLDESIALEHIRPIRDSSSGRLIMLRRYRFYFTSTGDDRYPGHIELKGRCMTNLQLAPYRVD
ncbi:DUF3301 domain-containing protein [Marinobacterium weihaiense]|uniref:DUF3301 domain-containing protein n=1 Tax=Marinobacterium weihaiense TaxID=2851016 RepID=A0ABS6M6W2_9GAMM|nr:DUF3301 domain-containing protein [Marinobacterium weihaiense]MBV0932013.1 DUF3301 domain-containing protein [Marinobacterium weihaiense]